MVRLMGHHVAKHLHPNRKSRKPAIPAKHLNSAPITQSLSKHLPTTRPALGQSRTSFLRHTTQPVQLRRNSQVRSRKPNPLTPNIVHMRKDGRDSTNLARRLRPPGSRIKTLDKHLVHPLIRSKDLNRSLIELNVNFVSTSSHGSYP
jgi:hypothetical protein